jgi:mono/diheme cytochrome c family protein
MNRIGTALVIALALTFGAHAHAAGLGGTQKGRDVFERWCMACHGGGQDKPGTVALAAKYKGSLPARLEERTDLTPDVTKFFVRNGVSIMPPFRKTEISDADLDALAAYLARKR